MDGRLAIHSPATRAIIRRQVREDADAAERHNLQLRAAESIGRIDALLAVSTPPPRIEHRASRCGYCGAVPYQPGCCAWSAGVTEFRTGQPGTTTTINGERCPVEFRPASIVSVR
jgi:hypothetical protein